VWAGPHTHAHLHTCAHPEAMTWLYFFNFV
jgi:hypothetical protein